MKRSILILLVVAISVSVQAQAAKDSAAIQEQFSRWIQASEQGNADALASIYTENAVMLPPGAPSFKGRTKIKSLFAQQFARTKEASYNFKTYDLVVFDDWAWRRGSYEVVATLKNGKTFRLKDKFIDIWKKGEDGTWRIARDIWNHTNPPAFINKNKQE